MEAKGTVIKGNVDLVLSDCYFDGDGALCDCDFNLTSESFVEMSILKTFYESRVPIRFPLSINGTFDHAMTSCLIVASKSSGKMSVAKAFTDLKPQYLSRYVFTGIDRLMMHLPQLLLPFSPFPPRPSYSHRRSP